MAEDLTEGAFQRLGERFDPKVVKHHPSSGFHYLSIDTMMNRMDEVLGPNWDLAVTDQSLAPVDPDWKQYGSRNPKTGFLARCTVSITAKLEDDGIFKIVTRDGVGADFADDADKAIKTALANAIKKACNGFGVGRYLWDEEERAAIDQAQSARNDVKALKKAVVEKFKAEQRGATDEYDALTLPADKMAYLAEYFMVDTADMASAATLNEILER